MQNPFSQFSEIEDFLRNALYIPSKLSSFPPYNIYATSDGNSAVLEIAVAGYTIDDVKIELVDGKLIIEGTRPESDHSLWVEIHKGISTKEFTLKFNINRSFDVASAKMSDGMLVIKLERVEGSKKPIAIECAK